MFRSLGGDRFDQEFADDTKVRSMVLAVRDGAATIGQPYQPTATTLGHKMILIIDMGLGNLDSVRQAFNRVGAEVQISNQPEQVRCADVLVLPGVGAFGDGIDSLARLQLIQPIQEHALQRRRPLLGICLGMHLLADEGFEHGHHQGLGLIAGQVSVLQPTDRRYRVPNMGWCDVTFADDAAPFESFRQPQSFYFAHSYHFQCAHQEDVAGTIDYDSEFVVAAVRRDSILGVQFHPEKSQDSGLDLLESFVRHSLDVVNV